MTDLHRRAILRGTALSAMAVAASAPSSSTANVHGKDGPIELFTVADRAMLTSLPSPAPGHIIHLSEIGREGLFKCVPGEVPASDPLQGLHIPSSRPGLHFARIWDGTHGRPEWFGAIPNVPSFDCAPALEACYALCPVSELSQADYFIHRTVHFQHSWRTFRGIGNYATDQGRGTRIILQRAAPGLHTDDIMVVGSIAQPSPNSDGFPYENHFSNFTLIRDGACTPHPSGDITQYPTGLRASFLFHCTFKQITSLESSVGYYIGGVVYTTFDDCYAVRVTAGTTPDHDFAVGYYLNGHINFGYAGGNASLYINRCSVADQHPSHVDPTGLLAKGAFVDTFLDHFESARISTGITFAVDGARGIGQSIDVHIRNPVLDGCAKFGINIDLDQTSSASIEIVDPYIYSAGSVGDRGILIHGGAGLATITGGQVHGDFAGGSLWFSRTRGVKVQGTKIHQSVKPVVVDEASGLYLEPQINNDAKHSPNFAITCRALTRSIIRPVIVGTDGPSFQGGITLDGATNHCEIDGSAIDPTCFSVADARFKLWYKSADARGGPAAAAFSTAGNVLVGVTG